MAWTPQQIKLHHIAAKAAGWDTARRSLVLRHVGAVDRDGRGSSRARANTQAQFEHYMAIAEHAAHAAGNGDEFPPADRLNRRRTWAEASLSATTRAQRLITVIAAEAIERLPGTFHDAFLRAFVLRMTGGDEPSLCGGSGGAHPTRLDECDEAQTYRILEGLKAWVGREFGRAGIKPTSFKSWGASAPIKTGASA